MRNISSAFSINGDARSKAGMTNSATLAILVCGDSRLPYSTPLLLGTPFTLREGATAMATARAKALKMDSRQ